jgi:hypothetical protein
MATALKQVLASPAILPATIVAASIAYVGTRVGGTGDKLAAAGDKLAAAGETHAAAVAGAGDKLAAAGEKHAAAVAGAGKGLFAIAGAHGAHSLGTDSLFTWLTATASYMFGRPATTAAVGAAHASNGAASAGACTRVHPAPRASAPLLALTGSARVAVRAQTRRVRRSVVARRGAQPAAAPHFPVRARVAAGPPSAPLLVYAFCTSLLCASTL